MKRAILSILGVAICVVLAGVGLAVEEGSPLAATSEPGVPAHGDASDTVVLFYKLLLQADPLTLDDENQVFHATSAIRLRLVAMGKGKASDPVVFELFRKHKDLFMPANMRSPADIQVSSGFHWVRNLERMKDPPKSGYETAMALFVHDVKAAPPRFQTVVFTVSDGKIDPDDIYLDGYEGKLTLQEFQQDLGL